MELKNAIEVLDTITYDVMAQYEMVRSSGACNMLDYHCVMRAADAMDCFDLTSLTRNEYILILENFTTLMEYYRIEQE